MKVHTFLLKSIKLAKMDLFLALNVGQCIKKNSDHCLNNTQQSLILSLKSIFGIFYPLEDSKLCISNTFDGCCW